MKVRKFWVGFATALVLWLPTPAKADSSDPLRAYYEQAIADYPSQWQQLQQTANPISLEVLTFKQNMGTAFQYVGQWEQASQLLHDGLAMARALGDRDRELTILDQLAHTYAMDGYQTQINFLEQEVNQAPDLDSQLIALKVLGSIHYTNAQYNEALAAHRQYLALVAPLDRPKETAEALRDMGQIWMSKGDYGEAIHYLTSSLELAQRLKDVTLINGVMTQLGTAYRFNDQTPKAIATFGAALALAQSNNDVVNQWLHLNYLAMIYTALGDLDQVVNLQQQRLTISKTTGNIFWEALTLEDLSGAEFWRGNYAQAIALQTQALELFNQFNPEAYNLAQAQEKLGFLYWRNGQWKQAQAALEDSLVRFDRERQTILNNSNLIGLSPEQLSNFQYEASADIYRLMQRILVNQGLTDQALEASEQGRARAYVDSLVSNFQTNPNVHITKAPPTVEEIKAIAQAENTTIVQYTIIYDYSRLYRYRFGKDQPFTKADQILIWVIQPNGEITFKTVDLEGIDLAALVEQMRSSLLTPSQRNLGAQLNQSRYRLYQMLIEPIKPWLPKDPHETVTFIPQDSLLMVPFNALENADGQPLIDLHTIMTAPAIQVLDIARQIKSSSDRNQEALVIGNPTMPDLPTQPGQTRQQLAPLPGAEIEANLIAEILNTKPLIGEEANKQTVIDRMKTAEIMHFATHGLLDYSEGLMSSLALAPGDGDTGFLRANEIMDLNLKAQLAVLSACDTGLGRITGDGMVGLSRSFITAGVPSVVVSLWKIPDEPTAFLMTEFYRQLNQGQSKAIALRAAMLATRSQYPEPRNWAAFTLMGLDR